MQWGPNDSFIFITSIILFNCGDVCQCLLQLESLIFWFSFDVVLRLGCIWRFSLETITLIRGMDGLLLTFSTSGFATPVPILSYPLDDLVEVLGLDAEMGRERFTSASSPSATSSWTSMAPTTTTVLAVVLEFLLDDSYFSSQRYEFLLLF